ncbi:MAG TPA: ribosome maturation factor RimP [Myxococcaceae bacterium]|nr:ribosome maturation factor RimP [Myxococcaceae bacterium]
MAESTHRQDVVSRAEALVEPIVRAEGFELVELEHVREPAGWVLRLFIDRPGRDPMSKEGGIGLEECAQVSHAVETALEVEDLVPHAYSLEVSSPGINRPLRRPEHFAKVVGQRVKVKTYGPVGQPPRKSFSGVLLQSSSSDITVQVEGGGAFHIPFRDIAKANLDFEF